MLPLPLISYLYLLPVSHLASAWLVIKSLLSCVKNSLTIATTVFLHPRWPLRKHVANVAWLHSLR